MKPRTQHSPAGLLLGLAILLGQGGLPGPLDAQEIFITHLAIPMPDGVELTARLYRPAEMEAPVPVIVTLTPYTADDAHARARFFAENGYVFLNVDTRGRGGSGGEYRPLAQDGPDGAAVVEWVAQQEWSDGRVAMRGGSYRGMVQWQTLRERPSSLVTIVPTASVYPGWDFPNPSGIFMSYAAQWLAFTEIGSAQGDLFGDGQYWSSRFSVLRDEGRPFGELAQVTGASGRILDEWLEHPHFTEYWQAMSPGPDDYAGFDLPILTITGHFDGDQPGAMKYYRDHMEAAPESASRNHWLLMGPWNHGGTRNPSPSTAGLSFGEESVLDMEALHLEWFHWIFHDGPRPGILEDRVVYWVMGSEEWRSAPSLDAVAQGERSFYLSSPGSDASEVFRPGRLGGEPPSEADSDSYVHDPLEEPGWGGPGGGASGAGSAFRWGPKLVYQSDPVESALEVAGYMELEAWLELDVPDTDIVANVYEIRRNGQTIRLGTSELRARHRHGEHTSELVEVGQVERYHFDRFYWFARTVEAGSRIRLVLTPLNTPSRQINYQSGLHPMEETPADARVGTIRLHHGPDHPSRLVLPVREQAGTR